MSSTTDIKFLQINLNKSQEATESALELAIENQIEIILGQEPWLTPKNKSDQDYQNIRSVSHKDFYQIFPNHCTEHRPRTLVYASQRLKPIIALSSSSPQDPDFQILELTDGKCKIHILNCYNQQDQAGSNIKKFERCLYSLSLPRKAFIAGDFNLHHILWGQRTSSSPEAEKFVEWMEENQLELIKKPGK